MFIEQKKYLAVITYVATNNIRVIVILSTFIKLKLLGCSRLSLTVQTFNNPLFIHYSNV